GSTGGSAGATWAAGRWQPLAPRMQARYTTSLLRTISSTPTICISQILCSLFVRSCAGADGSAWAERSDPPRVRHCWLFSVYPPGVHADGCDRPQPGLQPPGRSGNREPEHAREGRVQGRVIIQDDRAAVRVERLDRGSWLDARALEQQRRRKSLVRGQ